MSNRLKQLTAWLLLGSGIQFYSGCAAWRKEPVLPARNSVVRDQLLVYSDFSLPRHHRLLDELAAQRNDVATQLNLPISDEPIHVYLFESSRGYADYISRNYPDFPARRAFFVESDTQLMVFAYWGDRVAEDLRHEVAHGYLHAVVPNIPLWLDEGLAEYFEVPRGMLGLNDAHVKLLLHRHADGEWEPNLRSLEMIDSVDEMTQLAYAESWAWVHFLLRTTEDRQEVLARYVNSIREPGSVVPLSKLLKPNESRIEESLIEHLQSLTLAE